MLFKRTPKTVETEARKKVLEKNSANAAIHKKELVPITQELIDQLCATISCGAHVEVACAAMSITRKTLTKWLKLGTEDLDKYLDMEDSGHDMSNIEISKHAELALKFRRAAADLEIDLVNNIKKSESWQGSSFLLERMFPERWAKKSDKGLDAEGNKQKNIKYVIMAPEENVSIEDWTNQKKSLTIKNNELIIQGTKEK